jgi:transposase InsO family protein
VCDICAKTKITRASFPRNPHRLDNLSPGERVSGDVIIFLNTTSLEGYKYVLLLMDQASKYVWSYPLKSRTGTEVAAAVRTFLTRDLPPLRLSIRYFHSDGGSELIGEQVRSLLREKGISTSHTPRDTPEMNSLLERKVREIKQRVSCMLLHSGLPLPFWWMAWKTATQLNPAPAVHANTHV